MARQRLVRDTRGASLVEYLVVLGLVAVVVIGGLKVFSKSLRGVTDKEGERVASLEGWETNAGESSLPKIARGPARGGECQGGQCKKPGNCFVTGTLVATEAGERPIESIAIGDRVLARDEGSGEVAYRAVVRTFITPHREVIHVALRSSVTIETIAVTKEHPFWVRSRGWVLAGSLEPGFELVDANGGPVVVEALATAAAEETVYNFEVERAHSYFVGASEVWVHNECRDANHARQILDGEQTKQKLTQQERAIRALDLVSELLDANKPDIASQILKNEAANLRTVAATKPKGSDEAKLLEAIAKNFEARAKGYEAGNPEAGFSAAAAIYNAGQDAQRLAATLGNADDKARLQAIGADSVAQAQILFQSALNTQQILGEGLLKTYRAIVNASFDKQIKDVFWEKSKEKLRQDKNVANAVFDEVERIMKETGLPFHVVWDRMAQSKTVFGGKGPQRPKGWPAGPFGDRGGGFVNYQDGAFFIRDNKTTRGLLAPFSKISEGLGNGNAELVDKGREETIKALRDNDQWDIAKVVLEGFVKNAESTAGKDAAQTLKDNESRQWWAAKTEQFIGEEVPILILSGVISGGAGWVARGGAAALKWGPRAVKATQVAVEIGVFVPTEKVLSQMINDKQADWSPKALARDYAFTIGGYVVFKAIGRGWQYFRARGGKELVKGVAEELGEAGGKVKPEGPGGKVPGEALGKISEAPKFPPRTTASDEAAKKVTDAMEAAGIGKKKAVGVLIHEDGTVSVGFSGGDPKEVQKWINRLKALPPDKALPANFKFSPADVDPAVIAKLKPGTNPDGTPFTRSGVCAEPRVCMGPQSESPVSGMTVRWHGDPATNPHPVSPGSAEMAPCPKCAVPDNIVIITGKLKLSLPKGGTEIKPPPPPADPKPPEGFPPCPGK